MAVGGYLRASASDFVDHLFYAVQLDWERAGMDSVSIPVRQEVSLNDLLYGGQTEKSEWLMGTLAEINHSQGKGAVSLGA